LAGEILKAKREELCLNIKEIAERLKIRADYLSAIEDDSYDKLPAPVYTMGYIRSYAAYLDVDAESVVQFYREHSSQPHHSTIIPLAHFKKKSSRIVYLFVLLPVLAAAFFARSYIVSGPPVKTPEDIERGAAVQTMTEQDTTRHDTVTVPQPPEHSLRITATAPTWISIRFHDGKKERMTLQPGDSKSWQFTEEASLRIGNAGGIRINFDGKDMGSPGLSGEVKSVAFPDTQDLSG
jgi:cytoskeletal protein RodZ